MIKSGIRLLVKIDDGYIFHIKPESKWDYGVVDIWQYLLKLNRLVYEYISIKQATLLLVLIYSILEYSDRHKLKWRTWMNVPNKILCKKLNTGNVCYLLWVWKTRKSDDGRDRDSSYSGGAILISRRTWLKKKNY